MANAVISITGLYTLDNTIFEALELPTGVNKQNVIDSILLDCAELEMLYPDANAMKTMIGIWSRREAETWQRIYNASIAEYNPIENYDRHQSDSRQETHSGDDVTVGTSSGQSGTSTTETGSLSDDKLHKYAAFDSGSLADQTEDIQTASSSRTQNATGTESQNARNTFTHGEKVGETFTSYIHGNIGVTTSQQMLESELEVSPKLNIINYVVNSFKMRFCILVY